MKRLFQLINRNFFVDKIHEIIKPKKQAKNPPLITISREMGSGGRLIAYQVAKKLGAPWRVYHREIVDEIAKQTNLEKKLIKEIDENKIPLIEEVIADFFGRRYLNLSSYYRQLVKILSSVGQRGYVIIVGRGAHNLFPHALKIRIICEMKQRIDWMIRYEKLTYKQAVARLEESDKKRAEFEKTLYNHDIKKAHHYDLVIRTGPNLSLDDASELIVFATKRKFRL